MLQFEPIQKAIEMSKKKIYFYPKRIDESKGFIENAKVFLEDFLV
jgi:hypothetical protein